jgi:flagellar basal body P-ring formation protein FlgA
MSRALALLVCLVAAASAAAQTVVPTRAIRAQSVIGPDDVTLEAAATPGALDELAAAIGREARVTLYTGRPIRPDQLGTPAVIERNALVRMTYREGSLAIVTEGRALDRAGPGDLVRVMNLASRQIVTGLVTPAGTIEVGP